jgi:glutaminyl-tRNA synthetase
MNPESKTRLINLTKKLYIDREDFRLKVSKKYYRLTSEQKVRLRYSSGLLEYIRHIEDSDGNVSCIYVKYIPDKTTKVKGCISWLNENDILPANFNLYSDLLRANGSFNKDSLKTYTGLIEKIESLDSHQRYQIERVGYFIVDHIEDNLVTLNRIVDLRESKAKKNLRIQ